MGKSSNKMRDLPLTCLALAWTCRCVSSCTKSRRARSSSLAASLRACHGLSKNVVPTQIAMFFWETWSHQPLIFYGVPNIPNDFLWCFPMVINHDDQHNVPTWFSKCSHLVFLWSSTTGFLWEIRTKSAPSSRQCVVPADLGSAPPHFPPLAARRPWPPRHLAAWLQLYQQNVSIGVLISPLFRITRTWCIARVLRCLNHFDQPHPI